MSEFPRFKRRNLPRPQKWSYCRRVQRAVKPGRDVACGRGGAIEKLRKIAGAVANVYVVP